MYMLHDTRHVAVAEMMCKHGALATYQILRAVCRVQHAECNTLRFARVSAHTRLGALVKPAQRVRRRPQVFSLPWRTARRSETVLKLFKCVSGCPGMSQVGLWEGPQDGPQEGS